MQFSNFILAAAAASAVAAKGHQAHATGNSWGNSTTTATAYITQTVTAYETYCPKKTIFTHGTKTYTGLKKQWVTVTDCSPACTISNKAGQKPTVVPVGANPKYNNGTVPATTTVAAPGKTPCPCATGYLSATPSAKSCMCPAAGAGSSSNSGSSGSSSGSNSGNSANSGSSNSGSSNS
ncbi:uncharacterized protein LY89DRAFT_737292, partial [Mollisia scopiformis]